jgi:hypothetical protein
MLRMRKRSGGGVLRRVGLSLAAAGAVGALALPGVAAAGGVETARAARSESLTITAHLRYRNAKGSFLIEEGSASGALPGTIKARIRVRADITGSFTLYTRGGSISGLGSGVLHESGVYTSFGGTLRILGGTGRYAHASGHGGLYGVYNRETLGFTIKTTGRLYF